MHEKDKDKNFYITAEIPFKCLFFIVLPRAVLRTQPKAYGGAFFQK